MEFLEGSTLAERLERADLRLEEVPVLLAQMCDALDAAHAENIVHRDLKPENIWIVTPRRGAPYVKLLDFGIAKLLAADNQSVTQTGVLMGTPHFMSPEQCHGRGIDHRTDIYAMGVILYRLYAGRMPFQGETFTEILAKQITLMPDPPSTYATLPPALDELIMRCLSKDPAGRPQSAAELGGALFSIFGAVSAPLARGGSGSSPSTTLRGSAAELRKSAIATGVGRGRRWALGAGGLLLLLAAVLTLARLGSRGGGGSASAPPAGPPTPSVSSAPSAQPVTPAPAAAPGVAGTAAPPAGSPPATHPTAAAVEAVDRNAAAKGARKGKGPIGAKGARSRASDSGLVTDNPFQ